MKPIPISILANMLGLKHPSQELVYSASIDSRLVKPGDLFFALKGERVDGHTYLPAVAAKHAALAIVDASYRGDPGIPLLHVPDVREAMHLIAHKVLETMSAKVIAITGSAGKTMTKDFAKHLLSGTFKVFASPKSYNSQATLPLSILLARGDEELLILEMGMSEPGQIRKLVETAPPDIALLTSVLLQHVEHFPGGLEAIAQEKAAIFSHAHTTLGFLPYQVACAEQVRAVGQCSKQTFSATDQRADHFFPLPEAHLPLPIYQQNLAGAAAVARTLGLSEELIRERSQNLKLPPMRFEQVERAGICFINDAYNANPESTIAALRALPLPKVGGRRIAVLGEMDALGHTCQQGHADVATHALDAVDHLLCIGKRTAPMHQIWKAASRAVESFAQRADLEQRLLELAQPGDVVLLKGCRTLALDAILRIFP